MDGDALIADILRGDRHEGGLRCRPLGPVPGPTLAELRAEVARLRQAEPPSIVAEPGHVTRWVGAHRDVLAWSLLNRSGRTDDFGDDHDLSCEGKAYAHGAVAPTLGRFLATWPDLVNCRVNVLGPGASLEAHEEHVPFRTRSGTIGARLRFHLPLVTAPGAELVLDGAAFHLAVGVVHLVNQGCVHAARNRGPTERVHLVWDALLTPRLLTRLSPLPPDDLAPVRRERLPPHRRLVPHVSAAEARATAPCAPQ